MLGKLVDGCGQELETTDLCQRTEGTSRFFWSFIGNGHVVSVGHGHGRRTDGQTDRQIDSLGLFLQVLPLWLVFRRLTQKDLILNTRFPAAVVPIDVCSPVPATPISPTII